MKPELYIGYYSPKAAELGGTQIWQDVHGTEIEVTSTVLKSASPPSWNDLITASSELVRFLRQGKPPTRTIKIS